MISSHFQVFQHVSTAYCHMEEAELFEKAYDPPANPHHIIKICEWLRTEDVDLIAPRYIAASWLKFDIERHQLTTINLMIHHCILLILQADW